MLKDDQMSERVLVKRDPPRGDFLVERVHGVLMVTRTGYATITLDGDGEEDALVEFISPRAPQDHRAAWDPWADYDEEAE